MKFCPNCGKENINNSKFCPECGEQLSGERQVVAPIVRTTTTTVIEERTNSLALAGFITALLSLLINFWGLVGMVATILSGVALPQTGPGKEKGRGMAIAGLIIGLISVFYGLIQIISLSNV